MNRFFQKNLVAALVAMFANRSQSFTPSYRRPAREERSREEQVRLIGNAQMKRERRRLRYCGSST